MTADTFTALVVRERDDRYVRAIEQRRLDELPPGDVLIRVDYSSLNYKDALSATGRPGVTRHYPHTPGIDAAGIVITTGDSDFKSGDAVLVTGYDLGMNTPGGFGRYIRVPAAWVLPLPAGLSARDSMTYGTAGFTAALSVHRLLENGVTPEGGEVLVTGAGGGVGSMAVAVLGKLGFRVVAISGKSGAGDWLRTLGAAEVLPRSAFDADAGKALAAGRWAGVVDTVGGALLESALRATRYGGAVTCCGMVAGDMLHTSIFPFILRGVSLHGIDSAQCPAPLRREIWRQLAGPWRPGRLESLASVQSLKQLDAAIDNMLRGELRGRVVIEHTD